MNLSSILKYKRRSTLILIVLLGLMPRPAAADRINVVAVLSAELPAYETTIQAFNTALHKQLAGQDNKSISLTKIVLNKDSHKDKLKEQLAGQTANLLVAVGSKALGMVRYLRDVPIIYLLVPKPEEIIGSRLDITGVLMDDLPNQQLQMFINAFPYLKRIGLLYDPGRTGPLVKKAHAYTKTRGIELVMIQELHSWEVPRQLQSLKGRVDAIWMLPDTSVITPLTVKSIMMFSFKNHIPVLTFADKYLKQGATMSASLDLAAMAAQAAGLAERILKTDKPHHIRPLHANKIRVKVNRKAINNLGIIINPAFIANE